MAKKPARKQPGKIGQCVILAVTGPGFGGRVEIPLDKPALEVAVDIEPFICEMPKPVLDALAVAVAWARGNAAA